MMRRASSSVLLTVSLLLAGCGGLGTVSNPGHALGSSALRGQGSALLKVVWPARTRLIPNAANSLVVVLSLNGTAAATQTIARPAAGSSTTSTTFNNLAYGAYSVTVQAFPTTTGTGVAQAAGSGTMSVSEGVTGNATVDMTSTVASLAIAPSPVQDYVGGVARPTVSALDANGNIVLLSAGGGQETINWSTGASSVATTSGTSPSAIVTGVGTGSTTLTATMKVSDSGTTMTASATVNVVSGQFALATGGFPRSHGDIGSSGRGSGSGAQGNVGWHASVGSAAVGVIIVGPDGTVYASSGGAVSAIDGGVVKWTQAVAGTVSGLAFTQGGELYVCANSFTAVDSATGAVKWSYATDGACYAPNLGPNGTIYVATHTSLYAMNPLEKSVIWQDSGSFHDAPVVMSDGTVVDDVGSTALQFIDPLSGTVKLSHSVTFGVAPIPSASVGAALFTETDSSHTNLFGGLSFYDQVISSWSSAGLANWSNSIYNPGLGGYTASGGGIGVSPRGTLIRSRLTYGNGLKYLLGISTSTGKVIWQQSLIAPGGPSFGSDGTGYLSTTASPGTVVSFNPETGALGWTATLPAAGSGVTPAVGPDGTLYAGTADGQVVAIR